MDDAFEDFYIFVMIMVMSAMSAIIFGALFYDIGQTDGYCTAVGAQYEDDNCVKGDRIVKRGEDL